MDKTKNSRTDTSPFIEAYRREKVRRERKGTASRTRAVPPAGKGSVRRW